MKKDLVFYSIAIFCILISFGATILLPLPDSYRGIITLPGIISLFSIIFEAWRNKRAFERQLEILNRQQDNSLIVASHMANTIFDRQVEFCESYFEKTYEILFELFTDGPSEKALAHANSLYKIRTKYSPWISQQIEAGLIPFEKALRSMGASAQIIKSNLPQPKHEKYVEKMYDAFMKISNMSEPLEGDSPEEAISSIISHLRKVLGISELTNLRDHAIKLATARSESAL